MDNKYLNEVLDRLENYQKMMRQMVRYNKLRKLKNGQKERHSLQALVE